MRECVKSSLDDESNASVCIDSYVRAPILTFEDVDEPVAVDDDADDGEDCHREESRFDGASTVTRRGNLAVEKPEDEQLIIETMRLPPQRRTFFVRDTILQRLLKCRQLVDLLANSCEADMAAIAAQCTIAEYKPGAEVEHSSCHVEFCHIVLRGIAVTMDKSNQRVILRLNEFIGMHPI